MTGLLQCAKCKLWFYTLHGLNIHKGKGHSARAPDLIGLGIMKRKLTRKEAAKITKKVMGLGIDDLDMRFTLAVWKAIEVTQ